MCFILSKIVSVRLEMKQTASGITPEAVFRVCAAIISLQKLFSTLNNFNLFNVVYTRFDEVINKILIL